MLIKLKFLNQIRRILYPLWYYKITISYFISLLFSSDHTTFRSSIILVIKVFVAYRMTATMYTFT